MKILFSLIKIVKRQVHRNLKNSIEFRREIKKLRSDFEKYKKTRWEREQECFGIVYKTLAKGESPDSVGWEIKDDQIKPIHKKEV